MLGRGRCEASRDDLGEVAGIAAQPFSGEWVGVVAVPSGGVIAEHAGVAVCTTRGLGVGSAVGVVGSRHRRGLLFVGLLVVACET